VRSKFKTVFFKDLNTSFRTTLKFLLQEKDGVYTFEAKERVLQVEGKDAAL
jgi:hypothetical protein